MRSLQEEFGNGYYGGGPVTHAVEQRHHLRDGGHLHLASADGTDRDANDEANDSDHNSSGGEMQQRDGRPEGGHHADRRDLVAAACALGRAQLDEAEDEEDGSDQISERDPDGHPAVFSGGVVGAGLAG